MQEESSHGHTEGNKVLKSVEGYKQQSRKA